ncbi:hypothetical protein CEP48_01035 [Mergibacter septicus]|uniref:Uncharacterized protein n=1 Tax=Mergibacter septicus TaxID=221402 RepID=A0A8E3MDW0_9PAST|nr:DUF805 domain-containing protein [Mergibacter septicus]AWX14013.1 hypothetical protein CEP49_05315 [Mergibacter septicus]AWX14839.1 hypothetical protein CEP47_01035 [Mergibacter septicus]QDJ13485.1 hypothetical protein CEP45_06305 [Mergibacter septicus]QDJ14091.1 hypothetical protein CEP48_01035 [Mergibacter septicus]UTU48460.1 DUF805 domain-containing protein [Mergibacter septicus]
MSIWQALFSFQGRLNRQGFWIGTGICSLLLLLIANLLPFELPNGTNFWLYLPLLLITYCQLAIIVKRLHDRGRSAMALSILIVPIICYFIGHQIEGTMHLILGTIFPVFIATMLCLEWGVFAGKEANCYGKKGETIKFIQGK